MPLCFLRGSSAQRCVRHREVTAGGYLLVPAQLLLLLLLLEGYLK